MEINFYNLDEIKEEELTFVVITAKYKDSWIVVNHKERSTWEIPGGHIEPFEKVTSAAKRELFEETGAKKFKLIPLKNYSVSDGKKISYGQLFYADVFSLSQLPESEIKSIKFVDTLPKENTYPLIQPKLFNEVLNELEKLNFL